jgi:hypothetical protein
VNPLRDIAEAAIDIPELARGVCGRVEVEGLESVRAAQLLFLQDGRWKRREDKEGWSKLEHRVYLRKGKGGNDRWLCVTVGVFDCVFGIFEVGKRAPW